MEITRGKAEDSERWIIYSSTTTATTKKSSAAD